MGLDMSLMRKRYVGNWEHLPEGHRDRYRITIKRNGKTITTRNLSYITEEVIYWRKANPIHRWFVENVQDGNDDCHIYRVSQEQLQQLLAICKQVAKSTRLVDGPVQTGSTFVDDKLQPIMEMGRIMEDDSLAKELLPTLAGFFFGHTSYDESYFRGVEETIKELEQLLNEHDDLNYSYEYHSSW